ncbi:hypothetical protein BG58_11020 [Caballeronia jiangsuensis]|nr:hypothetical protein BG58_11020 [Caballeronia jiangsuensis]
MNYFAFDLHSCFGYSQATLCPTIKDDLYVWLSKNAPDAKFLFQHPVEIELGSDYYSDREDADDEFTHSISRHFFENEDEFYRLTVLLPLDGSVDTDAFKAAFAHYMD